MKKIRLTNEEIKQLRLCLRYYRDDATHDSEQDSCGLYEGKEYTLISSILLKLN